MSVIARIVAVPHTGDCDLESYHAAVFYETEITKLGAIYARVDIEDADLPYSVINEYHAGKLTKTYHLQASPLTTLIMYPGHINRHAPTSYFFENEDDAVLFKMKYAQKGS